MICSVFVEVTKIDVTGRRDVPCARRRAVAQRRWTAFAGRGVQEDVERREPEGPGMNRPDEPLRDVARNDAAVEWLLRIEFAVNPEAKLRAIVGQVAPIG
jgi:hypothetical protein